MKIVSSLIIKNPQNIDVRKHRIPFDGKQLMDRWCPLLQFWYSLFLRLHSSILLSVPTQLTIFHQTEFDICPYIAPPYASDVFLNIKIQYWSKLLYLSKSIHVHIIIACGTENFKLWSMDKWHCCYQTVHDEIVYLYQHADIVRGKMFSQLSIFWFLYGYKTLTTTIFNDAIQFHYCFIVM